MSAPEAGDAPKAADMRALRWLSDDADKVRALTTRPVACVRTRTPDEDIVVIDGGLVASDQRRVDIGRLLFESPALLGGAAARMGLSCSSCHLNGRGNTDFFVEGVSGAPGTADVTSSIFSKVRGDGKMNPVPIPDLAAKDGKQIRDRTSPEFRTKVHGLVVEEFDGRETPVRAFNMVLEYLDRLALEGCANPDARVGVSAQTDAADAETALRAARDFARDDVDSALLMARVSRTVLERMHERFIAADEADVRAALVSASRAIEAWSDSVREGRLGEAPTASVEAAAELVGKRAARSLYDPEVLRAALVQ